MKQVLKNICAGSILAAAAVFSSATAATVYTLGDSLSDAGALGITYTNPDAITPYLPGKAWPQDLGTSTPAFCNPASAACIYHPGTYYYSGPGNNYAVGGAGVLFDSTDAQAPVTYTSLYYQVQALLNSRKLASGDAVTILMGANDILAAARRPNGPIQVDVAANAYVQDVLTLLNAPPAVIVYAITVPDIGLSPYAQKAGADTAAQLSSLTQRFNAILNANLADRARVKIIDGTTLLHTVSGQFDNAAIYCGKIIDVNHACGMPSNPVSGSGNLLFADPLHPSSAAHKAIAELLGKVIR